MALTPLSEALERILATVESQPDWEMVALEAAPYAVGCGATDSVDDAAQRPSASAAATRKRRLLRTCGFGMAAALSCCACERCAGGLCG